MYIAAFSQKPMSDRTCGSLVRFNLLLSEDMEQLSTKPIRFTQGFSAWLWVWWKAGSVSVVGGGDFQIS
jgi:hypothetical protein